MAIGIFRKIGDFAKKVFSKGAEVFKRLAPAAATALSLIPHPAAKMIGTGLGAVSSMLNATDTFNNITVPPTMPQRNDVSGLIEFNKI